MAAADRPARASTLAGALALHLALFATLLFAVKRAIAPTGDAVPITLVSEAAASAARAAEAGPAPEVAQVETPSPDVKAPPPPAKAEPAPEPPRPRPAPAPTPPPKPAPKPAARPRPAPVEQPAAKARADAKPALNLDALQASLARSTHAHAIPAATRRGPAQVETAPLPRVGVGEGVSSSDQAGLSQLLNRLWNPNCSVEGGDAVTVSVTFAVGDDGYLVGRVAAGGKDGSADPVVYAAARRAIDAVHQVEPYRPVYRGSRFRINFDAEKACSNR